jgi:hypothetical protein
MLCSIRLRPGLDVNVKKLVFAKTYPEKRELLCEVVKGKEKAGENLSR